MPDANANNAHENRMPLDKFKELVDALLTEFETDLTAALTAAGTLRKIVQSLDLTPSITTMPTPATPNIADEWGVDPVPYGFELFRRIYAIRVEFDMSWKETANLVSAAPEYTIPDAPEPFKASTLADFKYGPRYYPHRKTTKWVYPSRDIERIKYALDATQYWIDMFNIPVDAHTAGMEYPETVIAEVVGEERE